MLAGLKDYQENGLVEPALVYTSTAEYIRVMDTLAQFVEECCELGPRFDTQGSQELYNAYSAWILKRDQKALAINRFAESLHAKGFTSHQDRTRKTFWRGIRVKPYQDPTEDRI